MARLLFPVAYQRLWRPRMAQLLQGLQQQQQPQQQQAELAGLAMVVKACTKVRSKSNKYRSPPKPPKSYYLHIHKHTHTSQILYYLCVSHADALDPAGLHSFLRDLHGCLGPLLAAQRALLLAPQSQQQQQQQHPLVPLIGRLTKHGGRLFVELQKRAPLIPFRAGLLRAFLELCHTELEGAAR